MRALYVYRISTLNNPPMVDIRRLRCELWYEFPIMYHFSIYLTRYQPIK